MENTNKIPTRDEIPQEFKWAIEDLYPNDEAWEQELAAFSGKLAGSAQLLYGY